MYKYFEKNPATTPVSGFTGFWDGQDSYYTYHKYFSIVLHNPFYPLILKILMLTILNVMSIIISKKIPPGGRKIY